MHSLSYQFISSDIRNQSFIDHFEYKQGLKTVLFWVLMVCWLFRSGFGCRQLWYLLHYFLSLCLSWSSHCIFSSYWCLLLALLCSTLSYKDMENARDSSNGIVSTQPNDHVPSRLTVRQTDRDSWPHRQTYKEKTGWSIQGAAHWTLYPLLLVKCVRGNSLMQTSSL